MPIAYPAGQDRNFPIFPYYTYLGGIKADKLMREADLGLKPWTSPELVAGAEFVEMMAKSRLYAKGPLGIKEQDAIQIFATGKSAMFWGGQWMRRSIRAALPPNFDLGIFPFPAVVAGGHKPVLSSVGITLTVNARSKYPDLAFEMIKAITGAWGKIEYTRNLGLSPNGQISAGDRLPDAVAEGSAVSRVPQNPPTGTRASSCARSQEAVTQGMQALITGQNPKAVMESVEAASQKSALESSARAEASAVLSIAARRGSGATRRATRSRDRPSDPAAFLVCDRLFGWLSFHGGATAGGGRSSAELSRAGRRQGLLEGRSIHRVRRGRTPLEVGLSFCSPLLLDRRLVARSLLRTLFFVSRMSLIVVAHLRV
jgi:hypothetical protein